jgi:hypothetical protein
MPSIQTRQAPLALLVVSQLESIKKQELALKSRLSTVAISDKAGAVSEISALQTRMDRLNRMIDAMSPSWGTRSVA